MTDQKPLGPPNPPTCRHGRVVNPHKACPACWEEDNQIKKLIHPLIDNYWERKGTDDLYHIVYRAYRMGMRQDHIPDQDTETRLNDYNKTLNMIRALGVPKTRAKSLSTAFDVLYTRLLKAIP